MGPQILIQVWVWIPWLSNCTPNPAPLSPPTQSKKWAWVLVGSETLISGLPGANGQPHKGPKLQAQGSPLGVLRNGIQSLCTPDLDS